MAKPVCALNLFNVANREEGAADYISHLFIALFVACSLCACGGGGGGGPGTCEQGFKWDGTRCVAFASISTERMATPFVENGRAVTLEVVVYRPLASGPYPTLVFHHGSTGTLGPAFFTVTVYSESVAKDFVERGYMVLFPQRRGRGKSDGLYDEGLNPERTRSSCVKDVALQGLEHALEDAEVITQQVLLRTDVIPSRLLVGGTSRGGILSLVHAARRPGTYQGAVNFVGGWLGEGCGDTLEVNRSAFTSAGALDRPSLWLYGENDSFYSIAFSRGNFDTFVAAGGQGSFHVYRRSSPTADGHLLTEESLLWHDDLSAYLSNVIL